MRDGGIAPGNGRNGCFPVEQAQVGQSKAKPDKINKKGDAI